MTAPYARCLVTGGAGFIGSHLVDVLLGDGRAVTVLDDLSTGKREHVPTSARFVEGSVLNAELVEQLVADHDIVYHLAAAVGVRHIVRDPLGSILTNVRGTEVVLDAADRHKSRIVLASTSEVYGKSPDVPFRENGNRVLGPTTVARWSYSTAKALDEHMALAYVQNGLRASIVRYFNSYGPRIDQRGYGSVIARFAAQAIAGDPITVHGDGSQTRCFTYVSDTVRGTILAGERDEAIGKVFNIGRAVEVSIKALADMVKRILDSQSPVTYVSYEDYYGPSFEDTPRRVPDTTHARDVLKFTATVDLETGLQKTLEWCRTHYSEVRVTD